MIELSIVCAAMGLYCIPECGVNRWGIPVLALSGFLTQMLFIFGLKVEEAHIVGITDNASSIIISFIFQLLFFQDYPNTLKIVGACIVMSSIIFVGAHKIYNHRKKTNKN